MRIDHISLPPEPHGRQGPAGWAYYLPDALGSVRQMADPAADVALVRAYEPFGSQMLTAGPAASPYGFAGEWRDATELMYLRARYYAPYLGQFISPDPFSGISLRSMTLHPYAYWFDNPVNFTDPSGRQGVGPSGGWGSGAIVTCFGIAFAIPEPFFVEEGVCTLIALGVVTAAALPVITQGRISARIIADTAVETTENAVDQCKVTWQYLLQNVAPESGQEPESGPQPQWAPQGPGTIPELKNTPEPKWILYHYSNQTGIAGILASQSILPSLGEGNLARYGHGQYFTDISPLEAATGTSQQLSRALFNLPFNYRRVEFYVAINVEGLAIEKVAPVYSRSYGGKSIYLHRSIAPLPVNGRVESSGPVVFVN